MVRRYPRYCMARMQVKMSWDPLNFYNMLRFEQDGFLQNESKLNNYQLQWKAKTHGRLYYAGDVAERTWKKTYQDRGALKKDNRVVDAIKDGKMGKTLIGFSQLQTGKEG